MDAQAAVEEFARMVTHPNKVDSVLADVRAFFSSDRRDVVELTRAALRERSKSGIGALQEAKYRVMMHDVLRKVVGD